MANRFWVILFVLAALIGASGQGRAQTPPKEDLVKVRLLADANALVPGKPILVAVELTMAPEWHTYWEFVGDAGLATSIKWTLPEGFSTGPIQWPTPTKFTGEGDVISYGYHGVVALLVELTPPLKAPHEDSMSLTGDVSWLVCKQSCILGGGKVDLPIPISEANQPANEDYFKEWKAKLPRPFPAEAKATWSRNGDVLRLQIDGLSGVTDFCPLPGESVIGHVKRTGDVPAVFEIPAPKELTSLPGVVVTGQGHDAIGWALEPGKTPSTNATSAAEPPVQSTTKEAPSPAPPAPPQNILVSLLLGFLGGMILNVMPCVFPVISIKIYGFVQQGGSSRSQIFKYGAAFVAGIFTWFWSLAIFFILVRRATGEASYSQQFQNPYFILIIATLVLVFALNLLGVFEVMLPQKAENAAAQAASHGGVMGTYFQGVFATILGTSCTAPVLGTALTFALTQPALITFAMFTCIAAGMGLPYLLLAAFPGWMKVLPRPGNWMVLFKQGVGFVMLMVMVWLLSVLGYQKNVGGLFWAAVFFLCVAVACWLYGIFQKPGHSGLSRGIAFATALLFSVGGGFYAIGKEFANAAPPPAEAFLDRSDDGIAWEAYTPQRYADALKSGRIVYVDFTAKWCVTCQSNKKTVLETDGIRKLFRENNVLAIQADYTNQNPDIAKLLRQFGRVGVPLNVVFPAGHPDQPIVLPELLTRDIVASAIEKARSASNSSGGKNPATAGEANPAAGIK